jgi:hypothetical protein
MVVLMEETELVDDQAGDECLGHIDVGKFGASP